jgi:hypothetical protein
MSTLISKFSTEPREDNHVGVNLYDMALYAPGPCYGVKWLKALTDDDMEAYVGVFTDAQWVVCDIREQYMNGTEVNVNTGTGFAQVYIRSAQ